MVSHNIEIKEPFMKRRLQSLNTFANFETTTEYKNKEVFKKREAWSKEQMERAKQYMQEFETQKMYSLM